MKKLFVLLLLFSGFTQADCEGTSCSNVYVDMLYARAYGDVSIGTSGTETGLTCSPKSDVYLRLLYSDVSSDLVYSTLLAAQMANKLVNIKVAADSTGECKVLYVKLARQ
ncbi:MAG: hypothetical protein MK096_00675 [Oleiphilaceae bacterium]|nr:hypothetical protein [Oleiphilaceae bacterium]